MPSQVTVPSPGTTLTTATVANVTSASLPAGAFLVWGQVDFGLTGATLSEVRASLSLTSATMATQPGGSGLGPDPLTVFATLLTLLTDTISIQCGPTLLSLSAPATLYLCASSAFTVGTITAFGTLSALQLTGASHNLVMS